LRIYIERDNASISIQYAAKPHVCEDAEDVAGKNRALSGDLPQNKNA